MSEIYDGLEERCGRGQPTMQYAINLDLHFRIYSESKMAVDRECEVTRKLSIFEFNNMLLIVIILNYLTAYNSLI